MKKPLRSFMRGVLPLLVAVSLLTNPAKAQQTLISVNGWNAYVHVPADYNSPANASKVFPTILFFPGIGEVGTTASAVILNGPGAYIAQGWDGNVQVSAGADSVEFIVISLQPPSAWPGEAATNTQIQAVKSLYRIDSKRLYLVGLSMGAWEATTYVTGDPYGGPYTYASQVAAVVDVEGVVPDDNQPYPNLFDNFALSGGKLLGFQQIDDDRDIPTIVGRMNSTVPNSAVFIQTDFGDGGHCCWEQFYGGLGVQPGVFPIAGINQTLYQWLARINPENIPPTANAGPDQAITVPTDSSKGSITLSGSGKDPDGTVVAYSWTEISGPVPATVADSAATQTTVTGLIPGVYQFGLMVTDNGGAVGEDTMQVVVSAASGACGTSTPITYIQGATSPGDIYLVNGGPWKGGDTIKVTGGFYSEVIEFDHVHGDPCRPVTIINDGLVSSPAIRLKNDCSYVHLTGSGTPGIPYGFKTVDGPLTVSLCNHIECDHIEITDPDNGVGIFLKVIPDTTAPGSWYINGSPDNYLMNKLFIHDNWIHNTTNEGMYIGATDPDGGQNGNDANGNPLLPLRLDSVEISNNLVQYTGWDGIQLSCARDGAKIHDNIIQHYGVANMGTQQAGIILGGNTNGSVYNNKITDGTGNGIEVYGYGPINVYNNLLDSTGVDSTANGQQSFDSDDYPSATEKNPKQQLFIYNNAFNHPQPAAAIQINADNNNSFISNVHDNTFCIPGAPANWQSLYIFMTAGGPEVNNTLYCPTVVSPGIPVSNAGANVIITLPTTTAALSGSGSDANGQIGSYKWVQVSGPSTGTIANASSAQTSVSGLVAGIYKFSLTVKDTSGTANSDTMQVTVNAANIPPVANAGADQTITLPVNSISLNGSGTDADGTIASYQWTQVSGPSSATISNATAAATTATGLAQGVYKFSLTVTDNSNATGRDTMQVTVNAAVVQMPVISSATTATATASKAFTYTIAASNTPTSYGAAGLPSGLSVNTSTGIISGTPTVSGTFTVSLSAINGGGTGTGSVVITINPPAPVISSATTASGTTSKAFTYTITASNTPTSYSATGLPSGLSINTSTGIISGTPTATGTFTVSLSAINGGGTGTGSVVITINAPAPVISSATTATGTNGKAFSYTITASNTPTSYNATGLPSGLSINTSTGIISGTPTVTGTFTISLSAINSGGTGTGSLVITINAPAPVISSATTASGTNGKSFTYTITASNTPTSYAAIGLPSGLNINTSTGVISGTPTVTGTFTVSLSAINAGGTGTGSVVITINAPAPVISSATTANGTNGKAFTYTITASNTPTSYNATGLPSGLSINTSTGVISGTPTVSGTFTISLSAINNGGTGTASLVVTINQPTPVISSATTASGTTGTSFSYTIAASNTPTSYGTTGLPSGLSINTSTGIISGSPTVSGTFVVSISAANDGGTATGNLVITINPPAPVLSNTTTVSGTTNSVFTYTIIGSNNPSSYGATGLPSGLSINTSTGVISGTPTASGVFTVSLSATNSGGTGTSSLIITVNPPAPAISSSIKASGTSGSIFNYAIVASNGPISYSATGLPSGLSINTSTGIISGTPTVTGTFTVSISAINSGGTGTASLVVTINPPAPVLSSATTASDMIGTAFNYAIAASNTPTAYGATGLPSGLSINTSTGAISGIPTVSGNYNVTISASNAGGTATSVLVITIETPPAANAGTDQSITLPVSTVNLTGTGTDAVGTISSYQWTKISGPASGTITNATSASTTVTSLAAGIYKFVLTVTNNLGATGKDTIQVTVNTQATANAGADQTITLPVNSVTLTGSGTDIGGTIASYKWAYISGPVSETITNATAASTTVTGLAQGTYKFALTVTDNFGVTAKDTMQVTVNPATVNVTNIPPVAHAGADQIITLPVNSIVLDGSGSDADGTIASYLWTKLSGPAAGVIANPTADGTTVTGLVSGTYRFVLTVTDNKGATGKDTMQLFVNIPPVANAGADQIIILPLNSTTLKGSGTDADGTIASYQWIEVSGTAAIIMNPGSAATTVTGLSAGTYKFALTVTDNSGAKTSDTMQVTVAVNIPPVANAGADQTIVLPVNSLTLTGSGTDADGTIASYQWSKLSGPTSGVITTAVSAGTTVTGLTAGIYKFVLTVTDNGGATAEDTMQVTVKAANIPPVANAGADQIITLPIDGVQLTGSGTDADGTIASYQWAEVSGPTAASIANTAVAATSVSGLVAGVYKFKLTVTDNAGATNADTMQVLVNTAPIADAGDDQVIKLPTNTVSLSGSGIDIDGTVTSYKWSEASGPSTATIANTAAAGTSVTGLIAGVYKFILTVTDNDGGVGRDSMLVTVNTAAVINIPPTANAGANISVKLPANNVTLNGSGKDADGTIVSYQWSQLAGSPTVTIVNDTATHTAIKGFTTTGAYQFVLTVTDNKGATGKDTVVVTINPVNVPPVAHAGADTSIALPDNSVTLDGSGSTDADGTVVSYHWNEIVGPSNSLKSSVENENSAQVNISGLQEGVYEYVLTVTDNDGATAKDTVQVTVTANLSMEVFAGPNPVRSSVTAEVSNIPKSCKKLLISLTSSSGTTVYTSEVETTQSAESMQINMSNLRSGMYFLKITPAGSAAKPIVKELFKN